MLHSARIAAAGGFSAVALVVLLGGGGCELIVPSDVPKFTCSESPDPQASCPPGSLCISGACVPKCDPADPNACPANETCVDGRCAVTCRGGLSCPDGFVCNEALVCVADAPDGGEVDAPRADAARESSVGDAPSAKPLGAPCLGDSDCASGLCVDGTVLPTATNGVCTRPCCASQDCNDGTFVCSPTGAGSYCVKGSLVTRTPNATGKSAGASCSGDGECRSGKCDPVQKICVDACCRDSDCGSNVCAAGDLDGVTAFVCTLIDSTLGKSGQSCYDGIADRNFLCESDFCQNGTCRPHCCGVASCPSAQGYNECRYAKLSSAGDVGAVCAYPNTTPPGGDAGATCGQGSDCKSAICDPVTSTCVEACCVDRDCPQGYLCKPLTQTSPRALACLKP
jgi:hypothetical protein